MGDNIVVNYFAEEVVGDITQCSMCHKFIRKNSMARHVREVHPATEEKVLDHSCPHCPRQFARKSNLNRHIESTHASFLGNKESVQEKASSERKYKCGECGLSFKQKCHYVEHVQIHQGFRFACLHCGKTFSRLTTLRQHARSVHNCEIDATAARTQHKAAKSTLPVPLPQHNASKDASDVFFSHDGFLLSGMKRESATDESSSAPDAKKARSTLEEAQQASARRGAPCLSLISNNGGLRPFVSASSRSGGPLRSFSDFSFPSGVLPLITSHIVCSSNSSDYDSAHLSAPHDISSSSGTFQDSAFDDFFVSAADKLCMDDEAHLALTSQQRDFDGLTLKTQSFDFLEDESLSWLIEALDDGIA